jgi:hypothetical protein
MATSPPVSDGDSFSHATGEGVNVALIDLYSPVA